MRPWSRRQPIHWFTPTALVAAACLTRTEPVSDVALIDTLKARIEEAYDFSKPGAAERMAALYPDSGQVVSASGGGIVVTADSIRSGIRTFWNSVGKNMRDPRWEWGEVFLERFGADGAVVTATWRIVHRTPMDEPHIIGGAWTAVFRQIGGRWLIVMEHLSSS